ncbi:MAG: hypothetical protein WCA28_21240, partial [Bradyrhizobium sp.]
MIVEYGNDQPSGFPGQGIQVGSMRQLLGTVRVGRVAVDDMSLAVSDVGLFRISMPKQELVRLLIQRLGRIDARMDENPVFIDVHGW